jgi:hypothetical protein
VIEVKIENMHFHLPAEWEAAQNSGSASTSKTIEKPPASDVFKRRYEAVRERIEKLEAKIQDPFKKEAIQYVLSLFKITEEDVREPKPAKKLSSASRSERMKAAWARRRERAENEQ